MAEQHPAMGDVYSLPGKDGRSTSKSVRVLKRTKPTGATQHEFECAYHKDGQDMADRVTLRGDFLVNRCWLRRD